MQFPSPDQGLSAPKVQGRVAQGKRACERRPGGMAPTYGCTLKACGITQMGLAARFQRAWHGVGRTQGGARVARLPWAILPCTFGAER